MRRAHFGDNSCRSDNLSERGISRSSPFSVRGARWCLFRGTPLGFLGPGVEAPRAVSRSEAPGCAPLLVKSCPPRIRLFLAICEGCRQAGIGSIDSRLAVLFLSGLPDPSDGDPDRPGGAEQGSRSTLTEEKKSSEHSSKGGLPPPSIGT